MELQDVRISLNKEGEDRYKKVSYPVRYGQYSEVLTPDYLLQYNLNHELKFIQGKNRNWPHPAEWLKRTMGNDWVYYFSGGYTNIFDAFGEYYLPCLPYPSNTLWNRDPFQEHNVLQGITQALDVVPKKLAGLAEISGLDPEIRTFLHSVGAKNRDRLRDTSRKLFALLQARITVLPPDARHVDYDVLPLIIADGCLYHCGFCSVKTGHPFEPRSRRAILEQIRGIKTLFGQDIHNYSSLFLGQHDACNCDPELIEFAAEKAHEQFRFDNANLKDTSLFLFGSVDSFLASRHSLFERLNRLPYQTYINLGLESADQATLDLLKKPVEAEKVRTAFQRAQTINREFEHIEVTSNFVLGPELPENHWTSLAGLTRGSLKHYYDKGAVYLSPLSQRGKRKQLQTFNRLKRLSRLPLYLYLIQRL